MNGIAEILNGAGDGFVKFAAAMLVQSAILIAVLYAIDLLIRKRVRAVVRYCMWMLVFVKLVLPVTLYSPVSMGQLVGDKLTFDDAQTVPVIVEGHRDNGKVVVEVPVDAALSKKLDASDNEARSSEWPRAYEEVQGPVQQSASVGQQQIAITWQAIVFLIWLVGVLVLAVLLVQRMFFVSGLLAQSEPAAGRLVETLEQCRKEVGVKSGIELRLTKNMLSPAACGLWRPVILMPGTLLENLSREKLRAVLVHELSHIKRGDLWVNFIQTILQIFYFYNPAVWFANYVVRGLREKAVDEMSLAKLGDQASSYSSTLIDIAEMAFSKPHFSLRLVGVVESKSALTSRIKHIVSRPFPKTASLGFAGILMVIVTASVLLPMAKAASTEKFIVPQEYVGHWKGQAKIIVIWTNQKNLPIDIEIHPDGSVEGKVGDAKLINGKLVEKSWVYTKVFQHENPYRIIGDLQGAIIKNENIQRDLVHISIRVEDGKIDGGLGTSGTKTGNKDNMILSAMDVLLNRVDEPNNLTTEDTKVSEGWVHVSAVAKRSDSNDFKSELWQNENLGISIITSERGDVNFQNYNNKLKYSYDPKTKEITVSKFDNEFSAIPATLEQLTEGAKERNLEFTQEQKTIDGNNVIVFTLINRKDSVKQSENDFIISAQSGRIMSAQSKVFDPNGSINFEGTKNYEYPQQGPTSIYEVAGVPQDAKVYGDHGIDVKEIERSADKLRTLNKALMLYANDHEEKYPDTLHELEGHLDDLQWFIDNVEYLGKAKSVVNSPSEIIAYDRTLLKKGVQTNVLHNDGQIMFERPKGIKSDSATEVSENKNSLSTDFTDGADFKATLANGVTVELVGLGTAPWKDEQKWWRPDGIEMEQPQYKNFKHPWPEREPNDPGSHFVCALLLKFRNFEKDNVSVGRARFPNKLLGMGVGFSKLENDGAVLGYITHLQVYEKRQDYPPDTTDVKVPIATGEYKQSRKVEYDPNMLNSCYVVDTWVVLHPLRIDYLKGGEQLVCDLSNKRPDTEFRLLCKLKNGETKQCSFLAGAGEMAETFSIPAKSEEIDDLILEYRLYDFIEFKDVSLKPRFETDVQVESGNGSTTKDTKSTKNLENTATEVAEAKDFKAVLANGVTVELVGFCEHPSEGKQWWRPDGSVLDKPVDINQILLPMVEAISGRNYFRAALKIDNFDGGIGFRSKIGGNAGIASAGSGDQKKYVIVFDQAESKQQAELAVGIASGKWETVEKQKADFNELYSLHQVIWHEPVATDDKTFLNVAHSIVDKNTRVIAIDESGKEYTGNSTSSKKEGVESAQITFKLPLSTIKEFQFQTRPYEWVTFKNVSLKPGFETDVQVESGNGLTTEVTKILQTITTTADGTKDSKNVIKVSKSNKLMAEDVIGEGWQLWEQRKYAQAEDKFQQAIALDPTNDNAFNGLGWSQLHQGKSLRAKEAFEKAVKLNPNNGGAINGMGRAAYALKEYDEAIGWWEKLLDLTDGTAVVSLSGLTQLYMERGEYDKAVKYYEMWLAVEPDNERVKQGLEKAKAELEKQGHSTNEVESGNGSTTKDTEGLKQWLQGLVHDFFKNNYRDITHREDIEWGQPVVDDDGNMSIHYKYEATIWGKDKIITDQLFVFDKDGNLLSFEKISPFEVGSKEWLQDRVEDFFKHNYLDITERETMEWGQPVKDPNGDYSIRYKYKATIRDKDIIISEEVFTFDKDGNFVRVIKLNQNKIGEKEQTQGVENADTYGQQLEKLVAVSIDKSPDGEKLSVHML